MSDAMVEIRNVTKTYERGKQKIQRGAAVRPNEEADLAEAERIARAHAKDDDSDTTAMSGKS